MLIEPKLMLFGGILQFCNVITDILYVSTQSFDQNILLYLCIGFIIFPILVVLIVFGISLLIQKKSNTEEEFLSSLSITWKIVTGDLFGITSFVYGILIIKEKTKADRPPIYVMSKIIGVIYAIFESIPQLIIQTYNSGNRESVSGFFISSCIISGVHLIYAIVRIAYTFDKSLKVHSTIEMIQKTTNLSMQKNNDLTLEDIQ